MAIKGGITSKELLNGLINDASPNELHELSRRIVSEDKSVPFSEAYNVSYADIYDFSSKQQSLEKWETELEICHSELELPWDQPVSEDK